MDKTEKFINQIRKDMEGKNFGSGQSEVPIWYNEEGDCIQFKTVQISTIRKRIDDYLTLYLSIEDKKPIGFQLKDVHALITRDNIDVMEVRAGYAKDNRALISVTITTLILKAFSKAGSTINRLAGYGDAFNVLANEQLKVEIPV